MISYNKMSPNNMKKYFAFLCAFALFSLPVLASAQTGWISCGANPTQCKWADLIQTANNLVNFLFRLAVGLASLSIAYAGWLYLTAAGDTGQISQAHKIFGKVVLGFLIMLSAWLLVKLVLRLAGPEYSLLQ
jgi:hypothetical protein